MKTTDTLGMSKDDVLSLKSQGSRDSRRGSKSKSFSGRGMESGNLQEGALGKEVQIQEEGSKGMIKATELALAIALLLETKEAFLARKKAAAKQVVGNVKIAKILK